ncbi:ShlB/FhaC/HecB family hemolysin secretion/activation protein [Nostoc sp. KVJ3]|uniref:ShlB/FhaC/HecB family hemolysin secretion/activation protein n=1 Tax=Nostoc sp. KVJ3 TaxID=457945 RepID=UPI0022379B48|nr:ShlB/FhaC/HecB family hemolysin secretion/activation protein [Nostoc sp. KVJ3]
MHQLKFLVTLAILGFSLPIQMKAFAMAVVQVPRDDLLAQVNLPQNLPPPQDVLPPPSSPPQPSTIPSPPPSPDNLLPFTPPPNLPQRSDPDVPIKLLVNKFKFTGSSVFKNEEKLLQAIEVFLFEENSDLLSEEAKCDRLKHLDKQPPLRKLPRSESDSPVELTFSQLLEARSAITQLYLCNGYITSGALIPEQKLPPLPQAGAVTIEILEGTLEDIQVIGNRRLSKDYIRSRLSRANKKPLNREKLLEALQLLQLNPRIENLSAELAAGTRVGQNLLVVRVEEAKTFHTQILLDNNRSPSVGSFQRTAQLQEANLLGMGDELSVSYANTDGSNEVNLSYALPLTSEETTLTFNYGRGWSNVIEKPFNKLDIYSNSENYQLTLRHPVIRNPRQELALGLALSYQQTQTFIGLDNIGPFPISPGADDEGRTRISALRFFQEWTDRGDRSVFALRSQFSLGLDVLGATINESSPDSRFFAWRGQAQWVRLLAKNTLLVLRGDLQLADRRLVSLEQFRLGGQASVRGFRQDALLADNGFFGSAEVRLPIKTFPEIQGLLQVIPFVDVGTAWNNFEGSDPNPNPLVSAGLGLRFQMSDRIDARFDWGIPLVSVDSDKKTLQEQGIYFSLLWSLF